AEDGIRDRNVTGVQTCALPISAVSTASFRRSLPWYCTPEEETGKEIEMEDIYHPLLSDPVENSLTLDRGCLITGSNASGKSTFRSEERRVGKECRSRC